MEYPKSLKDAIVLIDELRAELKKYTESPFVDSYLSTLTFINNTDKDITEKSGELFTIDNKVLFEMAHKYQIEKIPYFEQLEWLRSKMSPEQASELDEKITTQRIKKSRVNIATQIAINGAK
jgi:hypothetical protein